MREVKLDSGQVIGHVAEEHVTQPGTVPTPQSYGDVVMATAAPTVATGDVSSAMATSSSSTSPRNVPVKVLHLNPEQLKELNINLPNLENSEGPVQVYIIEDNAAANVSGCSVISATQEPSGSSIVSGTNQPLEGAGVTAEAAVEQYSLISGVPFQKSEESGFYSLDLDDSGGQVALNAGALDSGVTEATSVNIPESTNELKEVNTQSLTRISRPGSDVITGLVHSEPERNNKEDGVPPNKRRKMNSPNDKPQPL